MARPMGTPCFSKFQIGKRFDHNKINKPLVKNFENQKVKILKKYIYILRLTSHTKPFL